MQTEKKKEKETSDLFCFQVQEMDVFDCADKPMQ